MPFLKGRGASSAAIILFWTAFLVLGDPLSSGAGSAGTAAVAGAAAHATPTLAASPHATAAVPSTPRSPRPAVVTGGVPHTLSTPGTSPAAAVDGESVFTVLCYHQFGDQPGEGAKRSLYKISVAEFEWQMQYLKEQGIVPLRLDQVAAFLFEGKPIPPRSVLITFDDGFRSIYTDAYPVLKRYRYPSVLFLYTDFLRSQNASLRYDEIREMMGYGFEIASHSASHPNLAKESYRLGRESFRKLCIAELHGSATFLNEKFGVRPRDFAYPYGVYTDAVAEEARRLGYRTAFSINPGPNDRTVPAFKLKRHLVTYFTRRDLFKKIFEPKVLHLRSLSPPDGGIVQTPRPVISAVLEDDVDPKSIVVQMGQRVMAPVFYDPATRTLRKPMGFPLKKGGHQVMISAKDRQGIPRIYSWYFRVERRAGEETSNEVMPADPKIVAPQAPGSRAPKGVGGGVK